MGIGDGGAFIVPDDLLAMVKREGHELVMENVRAHETEDPPPDDAETSTRSEPATAASADVIELCPHCKSKLSDFDRRFGNCMNCGKPLATAGPANPAAQTRFEVRI